MFNLFLIELRIWGVNISLENLFSRFDSPVYMKLETQLLLFQFKDSTIFFYSRLSTNYPESLDPRTLFRDGAKAASKLRLALADFFSLVLLVGCYLIKTT